jgi:hypothetical protein
MYIVRATYTLSHFHIKICVEWYISHKNNIYIYINIIYPNTPLKKSIFLKV